MSPMIVDVSTGLIRAGASRDEWNWKVVQQGDNDDDWVLKRRPPLVAPEERLKDAAVIRIRDWNGEGERLQIIFYDFRTLYAGTCEPVK
jgi:hypothetical protein